MSNSQVVAKLFDGHLITEIEIRKDAVENNPKTWSLYQCGDHLLRVYHELRDTDYGPEMYVACWNSFDRTINCSQEAMSVMGQLCLLMQAVFYGEEE